MLVKPLARARPLFFRRSSTSAVAAMSYASSSSFYESAVARPGNRLAETEVVTDADADTALPRLRVFASESAATQATDPAAQLAAGLGFRARPGEVVFVPPVTTTSAAPSIFLGLGANRGERLRAFAAASAKAQALPTGRPEAVVWAIEEDAKEDIVEDAALGWRLGSYAFDRFKTTAAAAAAADKKTTTLPARLLVSTSSSSSLAPLRDSIERAHTLGALYCWARDLTNAPASDLGPADLAAEAGLLAQAHGPAARLSLIKGDDLLSKGWPLVHAVGRASSPSRQPVLVDLAWSPSNANSNTPDDPLPLLVLCGKGVCFDTGGLSLKTSAGMRLMKKDMGGGALVLALAGLIMRANLPVRLRALVPCVENSLSGDANRLGDVLRSRLGLTVEQLNTDAEGRLILADALAEACGPDCAAPFDGEREETEEERQKRWQRQQQNVGASSSSSSSTARPDLVIDVATLTGAARVALGPELPAVFCNDDAVWRALEEAANAEGDPVWRLPLHAPYNRMLDSKVADLSNVAGGDASGQAGAVVAALFLERFVRGASSAACGDEAASPPPPWVHVDTAGWLFGGSAGPGRPEGGEPLALRALWRLVRERYGGSGK
jgi:leucyl aminopeptidase